MEKEELLDPFDLTHAQKELFKKLKAAYKACEKAGIYLVNNYGCLEAYNSKMVEGYADSNTYDNDDERVISSHAAHAPNNFNIANEWADDEHLIKLTPKGFEKLKEIVQ